MKKALLMLASMLALSTSVVDSATFGELRPFVRGSWQDIRRSHSGRATIVHFWGLTCGPCRIEMPLWGELLRDRPELDLVVVNADLVPNEHGSVLTMLTKTGLMSAENWIFSDTFVERLRFEIDPNWQGEIPLTLLIAADGTITMISGVADLAEVRTWLDAQTGVSKNQR